MFPNFEFRFLKKNNKVFLFKLFLLGLTVYSFGVPFLAEASSFKKRVESFRSEALKKGISEPLVNRILNEITRDTAVLKNSRNQPEFTSTYSDYRDNFLTPKMIQQGRKLKKEHLTLLKTIEQKYGVPPEIILSIWGVESRYGQYKPEYDAISSISTLAFGKSQRSDYFRNELLTLLRILDRGLIKRVDLKSSWAGALGDPQFMPSSYLNYAVDYNRDGQRDIWSDQSDIFASIANYLNENGWEREKSWGWSLSKEETIEEKGNVISLSDHEKKFMKTKNFDVLLSYNHSKFYALVVGELSNKIAVRQSKNEN